jgi:DNA-binding transcriptional MerR regulator
MSLSNSLPNKQYFTIGEISKYCDLEAHTLRYWQKEFAGLEPVTRNGRRYYQKVDIDYILRIKDLLYTQKYSIQGACALLENELIQDGEKVTSSPQASVMMANSEVENQLDSAIQRLKKIV